MARYVAFLRGVSPMNLKMPDLRRCLEAAGFTEVRTLLSSGNAVFTARGTEASIERRAEEAMTKHLGRAFYTIVRSVPDLQAMIESDPFKGHPVPKDTKRIVTFMRKPVTPRIALPVESHGAHLLGVKGRELFTFYRPTPRGPVFMSLIQKALGTDQTTRTWDTVRKCAAA